MGKSYNIPETLWNGLKNLFGGNKKEEPSGYIPYDPGEYKPSDAVTEAIKKANGAASAVTNNPTFDTIWDNTTLEGYEQDYKDWKDKGFSYDFNGDAIYQQYKDKHIQQGKLAMADTIGQASAMTGGYGNSYAQTVGNQAYQAQLQNLNDIIPELYALAYDKHKQKGQDILNMIALEKDNKNFAYGKYMDDVNKLIADRGYYQGIADNLSDDDYNRWFDNATIEQTEHHNKATFDEGVRQFNEQMAFNKKQYKDSLKPQQLELQQQPKETQPRRDTIKTGTEASGTKKTTAENLKGITFEEAKAFLESKGVSSGSILSQDDWIKKLNSYKQTGQGGYEVTGFSSYDDYLAYAVAYLLDPEA